jgi:hypothetical protein
LIVGALLTACGGGGGSPAVTTPTPPVPSPPSGCIVRILADTSIEAGKTAGATVQTCSGGMMSDISWSQLSGPAVSLPAARSPTVSFEPGATGTVRLRADVVLADGTSANATADIAVAAAPSGSFVTLRTDHSVRPETDTSVRAWPTLVNDETVASIVWTQLEGPVVTMDTTDNRLLMFKTPKVSTDTVLKFRAVMTTSSGRKDQDDVTVGIEIQAAKPNGYMFDATERVHPYRQGAVYSGALARCTYDISMYYLDSTRNNFCSAGTLPLLQAEAGPGGVPSVAQIMGRVLVSHDFLGANFEQFLLTQDPNQDFRRLLAGVSAIVIGSHVRPSYYTVATGAIYLDAYNLWLSPQQRDVVTEVPDYRLAFDDALNFSSFGRQVKNNDYARRSFPSTSRIARTNDELVFDLGRLLYHELSHASDFAPPNRRTMDPSKSIYDNLAGQLVAKSLPSDALAQQYPLTSAEWKGLGQVMYRGATASAVQRGYTAADVGRFFQADRASDDYAYSIFENDNSREDLAMLFEEFMMGHRHGVRYDMAYTNVYTDSMTFDDVIVAWGERGRIAEPAVKPRIKLVLQRVAPWIDPGAVDALPAPIMMRTGASWTANLALGSGLTPVAPSPLRLSAGSAPPRKVSDDVRPRRPR